MKRITAIAITVAAVLGCSYVGGTGAKQIDPDWQRTQSVLKMQQIILANGPAEMGFGALSPAEIVRNSVTSVHDAVTENLVTGKTCDQIADDMHQSFNESIKHAAHVKGIPAFLLELNKYAVADCLITASELEAMK